MTDPVPEGWLWDLLILVGTFAVVSAIAGAAGAADLGTALSFGMLGFVLALLWVLLKR